MILVIEMTIYERIKFLREQAGLSQQELAEKVGFKTASAVNKIELGLRDINQSKIKAFATALGVKPSYLMDGDNFDPPEISEDNIEFAVIGDVAAGFDKVAVEEWTGDKIKVPRSYLKGRNPDDFFVLRVKGDSMYPMYIEGDKVLILKQTVTDYNGQIAIVIYDDELGTIKKVEQKKNSVDLVPINPQYPPEHITGENIEKIHILGIPKLLVRDLDEE